MPLTNQPPKIAAPTPSVQHRLALAERQLDDEVGDEAMTDVEVARPFPGFEIARVLRPGPMTR